MYTPTTTTTSYYYTTNTQDTTIQQGWECPRCGQILAPWMGMCTCKKNYNNISVTPAIVKPVQTPKHPQQEGISWCCSDSSNAHSITTDGITINARDALLHCSTQAKVPYTETIAVGGSDYKDPDGVYRNLASTSSSNKNKIDNIHYTMTSINQGDK